MKNQRLKLESGKSLLAVDAGNSTICFGIFSNGELKYRVSVPAEDFPPAGEAVRRKLFAGLGLYEDSGKARSSLISSVVPGCDGALAAFCREFSHDEPRFLSASMETGVVLKYDNIFQLGPDRLAAAAACRDLYPGEDVIMVDAGTACTFGFLNRAGEFEGGLIMLGPGAAAECLRSRTSLLPGVEIHPPRSLIGSNSSDSVRSGVFYGFIDGVDGIVRRIKETTGRPAKVVASGGWSLMLGDFSSTIQIVEPALVLKGISIIQGKNG